MSDYPCIELALNGRTIITFIGLDIEYDSFVGSFKKLSKDSKIYQLYKNKFIKAEHIQACRTEDLRVIFHKDEYTGEVVVI